MNDCVTDTNGVEQLDQVGKIRQRASKTGDFVDHHSIDFAGADIRQDRLQASPFQRAPGEPAVIIMVGYKPPTFGCLALDVGLTGLALGV